MSYSKGINYKRPFGGATDDSAGIELLSGNKDKFFKEWAGAREAALRRELKRQLNWSKDNYVEYLGQQESTGKEYELLMEHSLR